MLVGSFIPGETAPCSVVSPARMGHLPMAAVIVTVVASITRDSVGHEVGGHVGPGGQQLCAFDKRRDRLDGAYNVLARCGGVEGVLGRRVAFFRAVMLAWLGSILESPPVAPIRVRRPARAPVSRLRW